MLELADVADILAAAVELGFHGALLGIPYEIAGAILAPAARGVNRAAEGGRRDPVIRAGARYKGGMEFVLPVLVVIAMLAALGTLGLGIISMARGDDPRRSNKLMQSRVLLQGVALMLFAIFMLLYRRH